MKLKKLLFCIKIDYYALVFELFENYAKLHNCTIEIIDNWDITEEQVLVEDLIQIITAFSCRLQGKRANKAKKILMN